MSGTATYNKEYVCLPFPQLHPALLIGEYDIGKDNSQTAFGLQFPQSIRDCGNCLLIKKTGRQHTAPSSGGKEKLLFLNIVMPVLPAPLFCHLYL
jgi:hypothetical protein